MIRTLAASLLTIAATLAAASSAVAQTNWKLATIVQPPNVVGTFAEEVAQSLTKSTQGRVTGERILAGNEQETTQNVIRGRVEMGFISASGMAVAVPEAAVLNIPFLWASEKERAAVRDGTSFLPVLTDILDKKGLVLLRYGDIGWTNLYCKTACTTPQSIRGMKVRVAATPASKMFFEQLGANGVSLTMSDLMIAIQQGTVAAGETSFGLYMTTPLAAAAPHYVFTRHGNQPAMFVANKAAWEKLSDADRKVIAAGILSNADMRRRVAEDEDAKREQHRKAGGFIHDLTDAQREEWRQAILPGQAKLVEGLGGRSKELFDAIQRGRQAAK